MPANDVAGRHVGFQRYATVNRPRDSSAAAPGEAFATVRDLYVDVPTAAHVRAEARMPDAASFLMETFRARQDGFGTPLRDSAGRYLRGELVAIERIVRAPRSDGTSRVWQPSIEDPISGKPIRADLNDCVACHRAAPDGSVYTFAALRNALATGTAIELACDKENRLPCAND